MFRKIISGLKEYRLYLFLFVLMICFTLITGFNGLYGQDSYEYLRFTNALLDFIKHGTNPGKDYWPILYPICGIILSPLFKPLFTLQLVSIVSLVLSGIYLENILKVLYKSDVRIIQLFVFVFFLFSPYPMRASLTVMSDSLCLFFVTGAIYYFIKYKEEKRNILFFSLIVFATAAIATRYAAFVVLVIPVVCAIYYFVKNFSLKTFIIALLASSFILLPYIIIHKNTSADFLHHEWLQGWSINNFFRLTFETADGHAVYTFPNIIYCFFNLVHPAYCFAGIILLVISIWSVIKKHSIKSNFIFISSLLLYAFFLAGIPFQNLRFLILSFPFVLILFFPGFVEIYSYLKKIKPVAITPLLLFCLSIQMALFVRVFIPFYHDNKIEKQIAIEVLKYNPPALYTFSIDAAVECYGYKGKVVNMWELKVDTLPPLYENAMVLFNEIQFGETWKNKNPMLNWNYLKATCHLIKIEDLPDGWELYSLK